MLTTPLIALLCAVPVLGEAGESCRTNADCEPSLSCVAATCTARRLPPVPEPAAMTPAAPVEPAVVEEVQPQGLYSGTHFFVGVMGGAGPMWSSARIWLQDDQALLSTQGALGQIEARAGLMFGRFELALEVAPELAGALVMGISSRHSTASLSAGWSFVLHERDGFAVSLPIRVRAGGFFTPLNGIGGLAGCSAGVALRFGSAVLEARLLGAEYRVRWAANILSVPFNLGFTWLF